MGDALNDVATTFHISDGGCFIVFLMGVVASLAGMSFSTRETVGPAVVEADTGKEFFKFGISGSSVGGCIGSMVTGLGSGGH